MNTHLLQVVCYIVAVVLLAVAGVFPVTASRTLPLGLAFAVLAFSWPVLVT